MSEQAAGSLRPLAGELLLTAWEDGLRCQDLYRPLAVLAATRPGTDPAALAALPVPQRDLLLLQLRQETFGAELAAFGHCDACGEPLEFTLPADEVAAELAAAAAAADKLAEWTEDGRHYRLRPATTDDLAAVLAVPGVSAAAESLLARCLEADDSPGPADSAAAVPAGAADRFAELHAEAEITCALDCPACGGRQLLDLDIGPFLWREVSVAARRLLAEVHLLAAAYGWAERDILRLSPARRAAYLELAGAG